MNVGDRIDIYKILVDHPYFIKGTLRPSTKPPFDSCLINVLSNPGINENYFFPLAHTSFLTYPIEVRKVGTMVIKKLNEKVLTDKS
jgi:hypothetical protein